MQFALGRYGRSLITILGRFPTMPAVNRKTAAWCSSLLIIVQMVVGPVAHPTSNPAANNDDCGPATYSGRAQPDGDCGDCLAAPDDAAGGTQHEPPAKHSDCKCSCPCGHTPALAMPGFAVMRPALPEALAGEPKGPTFTPPLYDFLRPPN